MKLGYIPIRRKFLLHLMDSELGYQGYVAGKYGDPLPDSAEYSFWHGYQNGLSDSGRKPPTDAQRELARDFLKGDL